jgi:hypothetical protein
MQELSVEEIDCVAGATGTRIPGGESAFPVRSVKKDFGRESPGQSDPGPSRSGDLKGLYAFIKAFEAQTGILLTPAQARQISGL